MKQIAIIGGGISGLAVLHYLKKRYREAISVKLYERNTQIGGTISSQKQGFIFETGPNGFLTSPSTLEFIEELNFTDQIIQANEASKRRYIQLDGKLHLLPADPFTFLQTPLLSSSDKLRLIKGLLNKDISKDQSIYEYASKRFGEVVTDRLIDPFLTGIYAGDIKRLHMEYAFPKFGKGGGKNIMCSFKSGMGSLMNQLYQTYQSSIQTGIEIRSLSEIKADIIVLSTPAYVASELLGIDILNKVIYSPVAVVALKAKKKSFGILPDGFGYLIPSGEGKEILGVLLESNVFPRDTSEDEIVIRVMLGGAHHPEIIQKSPEELIEVALRELDLTYGLKGNPTAVVKAWPKGIPQYDLDYPKLLPAIYEELKNKSHIRLCANYIGGISFNDCIKSARELAFQL
jgi:oxygen-dependent protoporphyrinogen oxidase